MSTCAELPQLGCCDEGSSPFLHGVRLFYASFGPGGFTGPSISVANNPGFIDYLIAQLAAIPFGTEQNAGEILEISGYRFTFTNNASDQITNPNFIFSERQSATGGSGLFAPYGYIEPPDFSLPEEFAFVECYSTFNLFNGRILNFEIFKLQLDGPTRFPACISRRDNGTESCEAFRLEGPSAGSRWTHGNTQTILNAILPSAPLPLSGTWQTILRVDVRVTALLPSCCDLSPLPP